MPNCLNYFFSGSLTSVVNFRTSRVPEKFDGDISFSDWETIGSPQTFVFKNMQLLNFNYADQSKNRQLAILAKSGK